MTLATNLQDANSAIAYVKQLGIFSSNKIADRLRGAGGIDAVVQSRVGTDWHVGIQLGMQRNYTSANNITNYRTKTQMYAQSRLGNCHELAELALVWLYDHGTRPLDLCAFTAAGYDHVWVMIGLDPGATSDNLKTWGPDAVWCDPWQGDGVAFAIEDLIKGNVRNLNWQYKCNTRELVEAGRTTRIDSFP